MLSILDSLLEIIHNLSRVVGLCGVDFVLDLQIFLAYISVNILFKHGVKGAGALLLKERERIEIFWLLHHWILHHWHSIVIDYVTDTPVQSLILFVNFFISNRYVNNYWSNKYFVSIECQGFTYFWFLICIWEIEYRFLFSSIIKVFWCEFSPVSTTEPWMLL